MKVCSVSNYFSPYKIKLFNEIGKSVDLTAVILPGDDGNRNSEWNLPEDVNFKTYVIDKNYNRLIKKLTKENDILIDSMYSIIAFFTLPSGPMVNKSHSPKDFRLLAAGSQ